uniref:G-protein coupled receptors family 1 profile domain-containing protein n=1 Tax=Globodera rostochiensis TaxID=31243 RepID=A0A914HS59_GLORO
MNPPTSSSSDLPSAAGVLYDCPEGIYSEEQRAYRVYANAPISFFGIMSNLLNIAIFCDCEMRQQLVNHFLLALSVSDLLLLMCNFFFLVLPVLVAEVDSFFWNNLFTYIIRYSYPLALTVQTSGVYLTVLVSVHRFLGVCHPFKAKRWVSGKAVEWAIVGSVLFSFSVNIPTWLELGVIPCFSTRFNRTSSQIQLASFHNMTYILIKKCLVYTILMFIVPFATLITVNWKMVCALRSSTRLRTNHTLSSNKPPNSDNIARQLHLLKSTRYSEVFKAISKINYSSLLKPSSELFKSRFTNSTRDRSITLMLLAIVGLFLICNGLAFLNSIVESLIMFSDETKQSLQNTAELLTTNSTGGGIEGPKLQREEAKWWMEVMVKWFECSVEVSNVLITLNSSTSTLIYLVFSSKYRMIVKSIIGLQKRDKFNRVAFTTALAARRAMELSLIPEEVENRSRRRKRTTTITSTLTAVRTREGSTAASLSSQRQESQMHYRTSTMPQKLPKMMSCHSGLQLSSIDTSRTNSVTAVSLSAASHRRAMFKGLQKGSKELFRSQGTLNRSLTNSESNLRLMDEAENSPEKSPDLNVRRLYANCTIRAPMSTNRNNKPSALASRVAAERRQRAIMAMLRDEQEELTEQLDERFRELSEQGMIVRQQETKLRGTAVVEEEGAGNGLSSAYDELYHDLQLLHPVVSHATAQPNRPKSDDESATAPPPKSHAVLDFAVALANFLDCASAPEASSPANIAKMDSLLRNQLQPALYKFPVAGPRHILEQFGKMHAEFLRSKRCRMETPSFVQVTVLQLAASLFPSNARFHPILTTAVAFASEVIGHTRIRSIGQCARLIFLCAQMLEWFCTRPKYFPEVMAFLLGALQLCCESQDDQNGREEPFPTMNFPTSRPHRQMLFVGPNVTAQCPLAKTGQCLDRLSLQQIFVANSDEIENEENGGEESVAGNNLLRLLVVRTLLDTIGRYARKYGDDEPSGAMRPAFNAIFGPFHRLCIRLPLANYPTELADEASRLTALLAKLIEQNARVTQMKRSVRRGLKAIEMLEPRFDERFNPERPSQYGTNDGTKAREKNWAKRARKERRGALKVLRKDARELAGAYAERQRKVRRERDVKTKRILQSLEVQESEHKKLKAMKK